MYYFYKINAHGGMTLEPKILIVDDQFGIRMLLTEVFKREGYRTFAAENGFKAIEIVKKTPPDVAILDMKIPGMDGIEILKRIKEIDVSIKVIFMTAYGELDVLEEGKALGALKNFSKPFDIDEMKATVKEILSIDNVIENER